jgi:hypothetical protein
MPPKRKVLSVAEMQKPSKRKVRSAAEMQKIREEREMRALRAEPGYVEHRVPVGLRRRRDPPSILDPGTNDEKHLVRKKPNPSKTSSPPSSPPRPKTPTFESVSHNQFSPIFSLDDFNNDHLPSLKKGSIVSSPYSSSSPSSSSSLNSNPLNSGTATSDSAQNFTPSDYEFQDLEHDPKANWQLQEKKNGNGEKGGGKKRKKSRRKSKGKVKKTKKINKSLSKRRKTKSMKKKRKVKK